jgi:hypothetical protein
MKYIKGALILYCILFIQTRSQAQSAARWSFEANAGIPYMFASIPSTLSTYGGLGVRYNITTALSAQISFNIGTMRGSQDQSTPRVVAPDAVSNYKAYTSNFYNYALRGQLNLERVLSLRQYSFFRRVNPYFVGGIGYTAPRGDGWIGERYFDATTKVYKDGVKPVWTTQVGILFRVYLNPLLDLNIGSEFNHCQTYYLDGIYPDKQYDHYLTSYIGVNVKLGASKSKQNIEWQNVVFRERKPKVQPKDEPQPVKPAEPVAQQPVEPIKDSAVVAAPIDTTPVAASPVPQPTEPEPVVQQQQPATKPAVVAGAAVAAKKPTKQQPTSTKPKSEPVVRYNAPVDPKAPALNMIEGIAAKPPAKYTVIAGAYSKSKVQYAYAFRDRLRNQGYQAAVVQSDIDPKIVRVMVYSTDDKRIALQQCKKVRLEFEKQAWINTRK